MIEIIPAIIASDFKELEEKIKLVEPYVEWAQLDVMDGRFVDNYTWNNPQDLRKLETKIKLEAHLMIINPENALANWIKSGVKRIILHCEAVADAKEAIKRIKEAGLGVGLAINPKTPFEVVEPYLPRLDLVLVMTVEPGRGGQELIEDTLAKIKRLRENYPNVKIEVDGGINPKTAPKVVQAGANILVSGSAVFYNNKIEENINQLRESK